MHDLVFGRSLAGCNDRVRKVTKVLGKLEKFVTLQIGLKTFKKDPSGIRVVSVVNQIICGIDLSASIPIWASQMKVLVRLRTISNA